MFSGSIEKTSGMKWVKKLLQSFLNDYSPLIIINFYIPQKNYKNGGHNYISGMK